MNRFDWLALVVRVYVGALLVASTVCVLWLVDLSFLPDFSSPVVAGSYFAAAAFGILTLGFLVAFRATV